MRTFCRATTDDPFVRELLRRAPRRRRRDADEWAVLPVAARSGHGRPQPVEARESRSRVADMRLDRRHPCLLDDAHASETGVDVRDRRRSGSKRRASAPVSSRRCPSGRCPRPRTSPSGSAASRSCSSAPYVHEREPGRGEQVLDRARCQQVDAERTRRRAGSLRPPGSCRRGKRALLVREAGDLGDVEPVAGAVRDRGAADERRALVDRLGEALERDAAVGSGRTWTTSAPRELLRVGDLTDRRELELGDDDPVPPRSSGSALTRLLTACETEVVTATSSGSAAMRRAKGARAPPPARPSAPTPRRAGPSLEVRLVRLPDVDRERAL